MVPSAHRSTPVDGPTSSRHMHLSHSQSWKNGTRGRPVTPFAQGDKYSSCHDAKIHRIRHCAPEIQANRNAISCRHPPRKPGQKFSSKYPAVLTAMRVKYNRCKTSALVIRTGVPVLLRQRLFTIPQRSMTDAVEQQRRRRQPVILHSAASHLQKPVEKEDCSRATHSPLPLPAHPCGRHHASSFHAHRAEDWEEYGEYALRRCLPNKNKKCFLALPLPLTSQPGVQTSHRSSRVPAGTTTASPAVLHQNQQPDWHIDAAHHPPKVHRVEHQRG
ncbi:hypothetical protein MOQ_009077, partial [Trypanosoma cruzi marinkellei]